MDEQRRQRRTLGDLSGFHLPPGISVCKQALSYGWAYVFRHHSLGQLGRIVLRETSDRRTHLSCEVAGDAKDPMTADRMALFKPLALELSRRMEGGGDGSATAEAGWTDPPSRPPEPKELIESKLIPCEHCGVMVAMLILAPGATDARGFEDYARKMYPEYTRLNLPTWILGPALGGSQLMEQPADMLKVWPERAPMRRQRPAEFNAMISRLATGHCP
jgi:hypothetical protein